MSSYLFADTSATPVAWVPSRPAPPGPTESMLQTMDVPAAAVKRQQLNGHIGVITNCDHATAGSLRPVPIPPEDRQRLHQIQPNARARKQFDMSSGIFENTAEDVRKSLEASHELGYGGHSDIVRLTTDSRPVSGPCCNTTSPPQGARSPRLAFEPPARPGASFRRRTEKNYSDLFDHESPPNIGTKRLQHGDAMDLTCAYSWSDTRTEVARRNREFATASAASACSAEAGDGAQTARASARDGRSPGALANQKKSPRRSSSLSASRSQPSVRAPAGIGGCGGGGTAELMVAANEEATVQALAHETSNSRTCLEKLANDMYHNPFGEQKAPRERSPDEQQFRMQKITDCRGNTIFSREPVSHSSAIHHSPRKPNAVRSQSQKAFSGEHDWGRHCPVIATSLCAGEGVDQAQSHLSSQAVARERYHRSFHSDALALFGSRTKVPDPVAPRPLRNSERFLHLPLHR